MNEEELKKGCEKKYVHSQGYSICGEHFGDRSISLCPYCKGKLEGFQKGKLEERERIKKYLTKIRLNTIDIYEDIDNLVEQLQKEIGGMK